MATTSTLAYAEDMAEVISRYRHAHGLSTVKTDPQLTAIAERQAKAMAASGIMDHSVDGSFAARISGAHTGMAAENIAAGTKTWAETFHMWQTSPGHDANPECQSFLDNVIAGRTRGRCASTTLNADTRRSDLPLELYRA